MAAYILESSVNMIETIGRPKYLVLIMCFSYSMDFRGIFWAQSCLIKLNIHEWLECSRSTP